MNKRGNIFFGLAIFLLIYVFGVLFIPYFADDITTTRVDLDCTNTSITNGAKLNCLLTDALIPYFILFIFSASFAYLMEKGI